MMLSIWVIWLAILIATSVEHLTLGPPDYAVPNTNGDRPGNYLPVCNNIVPAIQKMFNIAIVPCASQIMIPSIVGVAACPCPLPTLAATSNGIAKNNLTPNAEDNSIVAGVHGLLDVLFATTFESFGGLQI